MTFDAREKKIYQRLRAFCLSLPETSEAMSWGHPNWRVAKKIFSAFAPGHGGLHIAFKARSRAVLDPPRVIEAPGWGKHGWVMRMIADDETVTTLDWPQIEHWMRESWELVAPKKLQGRLLPDAKPPARGRLASDPCVGRQDPFGDHETIPSRNSHRVRRTDELRGEGLSVCGCRCDERRDAGASAF